MKYFVAAVLGVICGAGGAAAALYWNPLSAAATSAPPAGALTFSYGFPAESAVALTHDGQLGLPHIPQDVSALWEAAINGVVLNVLTLDDAAGAPRALASRVSVPSPQTNLLLRGVIVADHWLITVPGEGSLFIEAHNNLWPMLKDTFVPARLLQREWAGPAVYAVTAGPGARGAAAVVGVSGRFANARGAARETYDLERFSAARGIEALRGTLAIELDEPYPR